MKNYEYYLISDIHLERKNEYKKNFLLKSINKVINENKINEKETIIVFSGDIDNGTKAYEWFEKINAQIIYIPGNHEFWGHDYYETLEALKSEKPKHVNFLHNGFVEIGEYIFIGSTMWTDVGKSLNDDLKYVTNGFMNDNVNISAKNWYTNKNIEKLKKITNNFDFDTKIEKKGWNILIEQEENFKAIKFFKDFSIVRNQLLKFKETLLTADEDLKRKYMPMSKEKYESLQKASKLEEFTYKEWLLLCSENHLLGYEEISTDMIENVSIECENIFTDLIKINYHKKIIVVSHHLPFLEERLIGYYSHSENSKKLYNEKADSPIYTIKNGLVDYPHHNYFYRIGKGEFGRDESIVEAVHYSNNGAINLPKYFLRDVVGWCHGHDHTLNYQDFLKGIPIITNPMSYSLDIFNFSETGVKLNDNYKKYHKIDTELKENEEVEEVINLVLRPISIYKLENKEEMIKLWIFSLMEFSKIYELMEKFTQNNKKFFTYLAKNPEFSIGKITEKQYQKIEEFMFSNYYYYNELSNKLDKLDLAYSARKDEDFSYMNRVNKLYQNEISEYFMGDKHCGIKVNNYTKEMFEDYGYEQITSQIFKNIYQMNKGMKRIKHLELILNDLGSINSITELFNKKMIDLYPKEAKNEFVFDRELDVKKQKILEKYLTEDVINEKERRYKERFNF